MQLYNPHNNSWIYHGLPGPTIARYNHGSVVVNDVSFGLRYLCIYVLIQSIVIIGGLSDVSNIAIASAEMLQFTTPQPTPGNISFDYADDYTEYDSPSSNKTCERSFVHQIETLQQVGSCFQL